MSQGLGMALPWTMVDSGTIGVLMGDAGLYLPEPRVNVDADIRWNRQKIKSAVTQGILLGDPMDRIADRLEPVTGMCRASAVRLARTSVTAAENAGRVATFENAKALGVEVRQEWLATLDMRTRYSHRRLDGEKVEVGGTFSNGLRYPGDPQGSYAETCNCRCTLVAAVDGVDTSDAERWSRLPDGMTYAEWKRGDFSTEERAKRPPRDKRISASPKYAVDMGKVSSKDYRATLAEAVGEGAADGMQSLVKAIMRHRGGTNGEDLYAVDLADGKTITSFVTSKVASNATPGEKFKAKVSKALDDGAGVALLHNHPGSKIPSASDLSTLVNSGCALGVIACHDGSVYTFRKVNEPLEGYNINDKDKFDFVCDLWERKGEAALLRSIRERYGIEIEHFA